MAQLGFAEFGNVDVMFTLTPNTGTSVELITNAKVVPAYFTNLLPNILSVDISTEEISGSIYLYTQTVYNGETYDKCKYEISEVATNELNIRIFMYDEYLTVYCNDILVYSYAFHSIEYTDPITLTLKIKGDTTTISDICWRELSDSREAVYVDYEATTENAIQSIIQQRPIEINPEVGRGMSFTWDATKDEIQASYIKTFSDGEQDNSQLSSDGIVYYANVGVSINEQVAKEVGFITRMYRLSELTVGALTAAGKYQTSALQKRHSLSSEASRIDPRIENRDILILDLIATGTNRHIEERIIVEDVYISLQDGSCRTTVSGRKENG